MAVRLEGDKRACVAMLLRPSPPRASSAPPAAHAPPPADSASAVAETDKPPVVQLPSARPSPADLHGLDALPRGECACRTGL